MSAVNALPAAKVTLSLPIEVPSIEGSSDTLEVGLPYQNAMVPNSPIMFTTTKNMRSL